MDFLLNSIKHLATVLSGLLILGTNLPTVPTTTPLPSPSPIPPAQTDNIQSMNGSFTYLGQNLNYHVTLPKQGGDVTGEVSGLCSGTTHGKFAGGEGGTVIGVGEADCGIGFIRQTIRINYQGKIYPQKRLMEINWTGNIPSTSNNGSFSYNY